MRPNPSFSKRRRAPLQAESEDDPLAGLPNLFDVAIVFAVALMVAMATAYRVPLADLAAPNDGAVTDPEASPIVVERQGRVSVGPGERVGVAYQLPSGEIVYLPDSKHTR